MNKRMMIIIAALAAVAVLLGKGWTLLNEKKKKLEKDAQLFE